MSTLTKAPPEEDTSTLDALDPGAEIPCEWLDFECPHPAVVLMAYTCPCGPMNHAVCQSHYEVNLRRVANHYTILCVPMLVHRVNELIRFIPIK